MSEYKVMVKTPEEFQKLLNQWRHTYRFEILFAQYDFESHKLFAVIKRLEK